MMSVRVLAANFARAVLDTRPSKNGRGRRECRVKASPAAPVHNKKHGEGTTGSAGSSDFPCAMGLRLIARSPWEPGFLAPIISEIISRRLGLSVGRPGPHAFAVRVDDARRASSSRPSLPASRSVTIGQNALYHRGGMAGQNHNFPKNGRQILFARGLDTRISIEMPREIRFFAHTMSELSGRLRCGRTGLTRRSGESMRIETSGVLRSNADVEWRRQPSRAKIAHHEHHNPDSRDIAGDAVPQ
jgi:hypothetical protein